MKKWVSPVLIAILFVGTVVNGFLYARQATDVAGMEDRITSLTGAIETLSGNVSNLSGSVSNLRTDVAGTKEGITSLETTIETITKPTPSNTWTALASDPALQLLQAPPSGKAQNVFLVVMDGVRYSETFGDPLHRYIPHIWNDLRPIGTINTEFNNNDITVTVPGHTSMLTGVWQKIKNDASERPHNPTIFEYYRKQTGAPASKTWVVTEHMNLVAINYSDTSGWGESYGARLDSPGLHQSTPPPENADMGPLKFGGDVGTFDILKHVMQRDRPSLVMVNLGQTDGMGHAGKWTAYTNAILDADTIVYYLWLKIQSMPYYKDKTTLILTNDHGRFLDGNGTGFQDHGGIDDGNRHLMFLAIGPNIKSGAQVDTPRELIDIGPTIASMMGINMTQAMGKNMTELLR